MCADANENPDLERHRESLSIGRGQLTFNKILALCAAIGIVLTVIQSLQTNQIIEQMKLDQRPWLTVDDPFITELRPGEAPQCRITLHNVGKTPATIIEMKVGGEVFGVPPTDVDAAIKEALADPGWNNTSLAPNAKSSFLASDVPALSKDRIDEVQAGKTTLMVYVSCIYQDVSGENCWTMMQYAYHPAAKRLVVYKSLLK